MKYLTEWMISWLYFSFTSFSSSFNWFYFYLIFSVWVLLHFTPTCLLYMIINHIIMIYSSSQIRIVFKTLKERQIKNRSYQCFIYKYYLERIEQRPLFLNISFLLIHISRDNVVFILLSWVNIYLWLFHNKRKLASFSQVWLCSMCTCIGVFVFSKKRFLDQGRWKGCNLKVKLQQVKAMFIEIAQWVDWWGT